MAIKFHADVAPWWAQRQPPPPISDCNQEEDNCFEWDSEGEDHSYLPPEPFGTDMEKSGVETRSSERTMLPNEAHVLLVTDSSSKEDSETDDQSYPPPHESFELVMKKSGVKTMSSEKISCWLQIALQSSIQSHFNWRG